MGSQIALGCRRTRASPAAARLCELNWRWGAPAFRFHDSRGRLADVWDECAGCFGAGAFRQANARAARRFDELTRGRFDELTGGPEPGTLGSGHAESSSRASRIRRRTRSILLRSASGLIPAAAARSCQFTPSASSLSSLSSDGEAQAATRASSSRTSAIWVGVGPGRIMASAPGAALRSSLCSCDVRGNSQVLRPCVAFWEDRLCSRVQNPGSGRS